LSKNLISGNEEVVSEESDGASKKTIIGVLASHDDMPINEDLASFFLTVYEKRVEMIYENLIDNFHFVFTGGTYDRIFGNGYSSPLLADAVRRFFTTPPNCCITRIAPAREGGIIFLSYLVTQRMCSIVWPFFAPNEAHWLRPENLAFLRLCDQWRAKKLMNRGSLLSWLFQESNFDANRNRRPIGVLSAYVDSKPPIETGDANVTRVIENNVLNRFTNLDFSQKTIALIAHNEMKSRMIEFATDHEMELRKFKKIIATGTTGKQVAEAISLGTIRRARGTSGTNDVILCNSGPKGGDIEIAHDILKDKCDVVIFFLDPLNPHPHIDDIRVVFQACMMKKDVIMITNEMHARDFMTRVVRT